MGLMKAASASVKGILGDQWKEYFYCDALDETILVAKGQKRVSGRSSNTKGGENIISSGSVIAVADGQCMLIVEQGKVIDLCAEPGEYVYDASTEPSVFAGSMLSSNIKAAFGKLGNKADSTQGESVEFDREGLANTVAGIFSNAYKRFTFGGDAPKDQRVYYFNIKELIGNKYGTPSPVPFRVVDNNIGLDVDISVRCFGEYSYRIINPVLFYTNICGNVQRFYSRKELEGQLKSELLTALQPAFAKISSMGIRYSALPGHTTEIADALNEVLSSKWRDLRGIEIVAFGVSSVKADEEDEKMIKELQRSATLRNPNMAAAHLVNAQAEAMQAAAKNSNAGAAMAFMGMNMANQAGGANIGNLFAMGQQVTPETTAATNTWTCSCGTVAEGNFCPECGSKRPTQNGWTCSCGQFNKGKFCTECGSKKPEELPKYQCDKCGWEPEDPTKPPKFCPECGDRFDESDIK